MEDRPQEGTQVVLPLCAQQDPSWPHPPLDPAAVAAGSWPNTAIVKNLAHPVLDPG